MRSRVIGLVNVLFIGSLSIILSATRFSEQPTPSPITPPPTKTIPVFRASRTCRRLEPPTETAHDRSHRRQPRRRLSRICRRKRPSQLSDPLRRSIRLIDQLRRLFLP